MVTRPSPLRDEAIRVGCTARHVGGLDPAYEDVAAGVDAARSVTREHAERLIREHGGCDDDSMVTLPQDALLALLGEASTTPEPSGYGPTQVADKYDVTFIHDASKGGSLPSHDQEQP